jgi:hypothetical protein
VREFSSTQHSQPSRRSEGLSPMTIYPTQVMLGGTA